MLIRNSLLSLVRTKGKTLLFALLIFALTLTLSLGVSVWASIAQFLDDADDFYKTIGLIEYIGQAYPQDDIVDPDMAADLADLDLSGIIDDPATLLWDQTARYFGYVEGFKRDDKVTQVYQPALLVVSRVTYNTSYNAYTAVVANSLYSSFIEVDDMVILLTSFGDLQSDRYYAVLGLSYIDWSPYGILTPNELTSEAAAANGIDIPPILDITVETDEGISYDLPEVYEKAGESLQVSQNFVLVNSTDDLMSLYPFHQEEAYLLEGREFSEEEYQSGDRVVIIPEFMAIRLDKSVGDTITINFAEPDSTGETPKYWAGNGFRNQADFKIIGITNTIKGREWYVYVPKSVGVPALPMPMGYTVGQAVVRNSEAGEFAARIDQLMQGRFNLTIYDQGYADVAIPFITILNIAKILTAIVAVVELAVLIFFGYIFVYRQRDTGETLLLLGAGKPWVSGYFLLSAGVIALTATLIGSWVGYQFHDRVLQMVAEAALSQTLIDGRYSNGNLSITRMLEFAPQLDLAFFLNFGLVVFGVALLSCLIFLTIAFQVTRSKKQRATGPRRERKTSHLRGGSGKYALLSILRGGTRTTVVPLLAFTVVFFLGQLSTTTARYQQQLDDVYENTTLTGRFTDIKGKQVGGQVIDANLVMDLYRSGAINSLSVSLDQTSLYTGTPIHADGTVEDVVPMKVPTNTYAYDNFMAKFGREGLGIKLIATNDFQNAPAFYYLDEVPVTFLEGYDDSFLAEAPGESDIVNALISTQLQDRLEVVLGDVIQIALNSARDGYTPRAGDELDYINLRIVGNYEQQGIMETIYMPLYMMFDTSLIWDEGQRTDEPASLTFDEGYTPTDEQMDQLYGVDFDSATFQLTETKTLGQLKDYLSEYGYSQVNNISKLRTFIVLDDAIFNNAVASLKQQIRYVNTLYPFLYLLVGVIAFVVSYLLVISRRMELATLRGMGASPIITFMSFFLEQGLLCLAGVGLGMAAWRVLRGPFITLHLWLISGFIVCYFVGSALSIGIMNSRNLLAILTDKD
ncbi:MAG: ABC transporter permease [Anaerolineaceae bacterium]|nr:ABC transporter permease [Anaerolineaceae bacterium]